MTGDLSPTGPAPDLEHHATDSSAATDRDLPDVRRPMVARPRLLDLLAARFQRRLTVLTAGAGFGKSTLLAQAAHDPATVDRGPTFFVRARAGASADDLLRAITTAVDARRADDPAADPGATGESTVEAIRDALLSLAPQRPTLVVDDIHLIADDQPGTVGAWNTLNALVDELPRNANLVLAGRGFHRLRLARRVATGDAVEITEEMLAFTPEELDEFARLRRVDRSRLDDHGWPALVELEAHSGVEGAQRFVAEEVLADLAPDRLALLRLAALHPVVDDGVVAALGTAGITAVDLVGDLPLTTSVGGRTFVLHDLWRDLLTAGLTPAQRVDGHRLLARHELAEGRLRSAFEHVSAAPDPDVLRDVLLAYGRDFQLANPVADRLAIERALDQSGDDTDTAVRRLLTADVAFVTEPNRAAAPLRAAADLAVEQGDLEVAALALMRLGDLAYRSGDLVGLAAIRAELERLVTPERTAGIAVAAARVLADVWAHMLDNAADKALELMSDAALRAYRPVAGMVDYYRAVQYGFAGHAEVALQTIDDLRASPHRRILDRLGGFASIMQWYLGRLSWEERAETTRVLEVLGADRQSHLHVEGVGIVALYHLSAGDVATARRLLASIEPVREHIPDSAWGSITVELATAVVELMEGDEALAAARLDEAVPSTGPFSGFTRHVFGNVGAVLYALVPRVREFFDGETIGPDLALGTQVGRALVALRERGEVGPAGRLPWHDLPRLRTWAYEPHLLELALAGRLAGTVACGAALDSLVGDRRTMLARIVDVAETAAADGRAAIADAARDLLAASPARPEGVLEIGLLGPLDVRLDGVSLAAEAPMRRATVRDLLILLAHRRRLARSEAMAALWPDKDERAGQNNLRTTLSHLRSLVETSTGPTSLPWHVRSEADVLVLHDSDRLRLDTDAFSDHLERARRADRDRRPATALAGYLAAIDLVRGEYAADVSDVEWIARPRLRYALDEVECCTRASELLTAGTTADGRRLDDPIGTAVDLAHRAVEREPLSERSHRALIRALRARGDRAGALRCHQYVLALLDAEDLRPEPETIRIVVEL